MPWPSLFGTDDARLRSEDIVARRRTSFWSRIYRLGLVFASLFTVIYVVKLFAIGHDVSWGAPGATIWHSFDNAVTHPSKTVQLGFNFIILGLSGVAIYVLPIADRGRFADPQLRARRHRLGRQAR